MSQLKKALFEQLAVVGRVLSSPQRIEILDLLAQAPRTVEMLSELTGLSVPNTSRHLQVMKSVALVTVEKRGRFRFYRLAGQDVVSLISALRRTAEHHLAQVQVLLSQYPDAESELEPMTIAELQDALEKESVVLLDVRPPEEFEAGHIPGAVNVPPDQLAERLSELDLPKNNENKTIVAYCRGPYCVFSHEAVQQLQQQGYSARRLNEGLPEWRVQHLPVQSSEMQ